jgi:pyruvate/2-oxoglutarate dehydrogenase complex dihydrolipoamide acyltransferase (E2) component
VAFVTQPVLVPQVGATTTSVVLGQWLVKVGDPVAPGTELAVLEADKAEVVVESEVTGRVGKLVLAEGDAAEAGDLLVLIAPLGSAPAAEPRRIFASPLARRLARERGLDLADVAGTGPSGRICRHDVEACESLARPTSRIQVLRRSITLRSALAPVHQVERSLHAAQAEHPGLRDARLVDADDCQSWCPADPLPVPVDVHLDPARGPRLYVSRTSREFDPAGASRTPVVSVTLALVTTPTQATREQAKAWMRALTQSLAGSGPAAGRG